MKEYESFKRIGTMPQRSYYIPFAPSDKVKTKYGITDRRSSTRFMSLDGVWQIKQHNNIEAADINEDLEKTIPVPSCVQMHGFDHIQYINYRFPIPVMPPYVPYENPCWHYRREFDLCKKDGERYYLNFEGVDSAFYLYINGEFMGYSQISHATSEFDITDLAKEGTNRIDVVVLKWCASTYLECQDKFRFSGIFRSVYILCRPEKHITDYKIETKLSGDDGVVIFKNESEVDISLAIEKQTALAKAGKKCEITIKNIKKWTAEEPNLYTLTLLGGDEKIIEKVGFREVTIDGCVFKINGEAVKLKGVNRHDFNPKTAATVTLANLVEDFTLMKELNVNAIRTSHYPNMPEFYQLCDYLGFYVMDEADLETHGAVAQHGIYKIETFKEFAENLLFEEGILQRHIALVERDKNRPSVIIWSLGNECCFGKSFFAGANYIRRRDNTRFVHFEGLQYSDEKYYYTELVDMVSMMYPSIDTIQEKVLNNPKETRPFVMCEYTHAMGNSCGDISDYWKLIYSNDQMMGGFVWEWADHAIKTRKGYLYGGDFGEREHDGNFCCDGLVSPDRKIKSGALEMKAVYGGKLKSEVDNSISVPKSCGKAKKIEIEANEHTGELTSIKADGKEVLKTPMHLNITRYTDNDMHLLNRWNAEFRLSECKTHILSCKKSDNSYSFKGVLAANTVKPAVEFTLEYTINKNTLTVSTEYKIADYIKDMPRFGVEFGIDKAFDRFSYIGFGPTESYCDKHIATDYGYYESSADANYDKNYVTPQESGSHYMTKYLESKNLFSLTADKEFSFSYNPYTTEQLRDTKHAFELKENDFVNVCIDLAMRGVGSYSCGPELPERHEIPKQGKNVFKFVF